MARYQKLIEELEGSVEINNCTQIHQKTKVVFAIIASIPAEPGYFEESS